MYSESTRVCNLNLPAGVLNLPAGVSSGRTRVGNLCLYLRVCSGCSRVCNLDVPWAYTVIYSGMTNTTSFGTGLYTLDVPTGRRCVLYVPEYLYTLDVPGYLAQPGLISFDRFLSSC